MEEDTKQLRTSSFCDELITRFFNSNSFFFLCLNAHLVHLESVPNQKISDEVFDLIQKLVQAVVGSSDKLSHLDRISEILGINLRNFFTTQIAQLKRADAGSDVISLTIDNIAADFSSMLLTSIQSEVAQNKIRTFLGHPPPEMPDSKETELYQSSDAIKIVDVSDSSYFPQAEALFSTFKREIHSKLNEINATTDNFIKQPSDFFHLKQLEGELWDLKILSMIQDFDIIEDLSGKSANLLRVIREKQSKPDDSVLQIIETLNSLVHKSLSENFEDSEIVDFINQIKQAKIKYLNPDFYEPIVIPNPSEQTEEAANQSNEAPLMKKDFERSGESSLKPSVAPPESAAKPSELKLPGEDDPELHKIVDDIVHSRAIHTRKQENATEIIGKAESSHHQPGEKISVPDTQMNSVHSQGIHNGRERLFKRETAMYLKMMVNAVDALHDEPTNMNALEDIELASYSVKGVAQRLGYETIGRLPAVLEALSAQITARKMMLTGDMLQLFENAIHLLESFETNDVSFKKDVMKTISNLKKLSRHFDAPGIKSSQKVSKQPGIGLLNYD
ncbi:hypothetical protein JXJ21_12675 [candidate division KSB1 bacterium]|nr:hypothetical protein [candidate division KSB1 bacterium]